MRNIKNNHTTLEEYFSKEEIEELILKINYIQSSLSQDKTIADHLKDLIISLTSEKGYNDFATTSYNDPVLDETKKLRESLINTESKTERQKNFIKTLETEINGTEIENKPKKSDIVAIHMLKGLTIEQLRALPSTLILRIILTSVQGIQ